MIIMQNNQTDYATVSATNENSNFPVSNVKNTHLVTRFRSTATSVTVTVDFGSAETISGVAIAAHNLTDAATVTVKGYVGVTEYALGTLTYKDPTPEPLALNMGGDLLLTDFYKLLLSGELKATGFLLFDAFDYDKITLEFSDATNPDGYIAVGRIYTGNVTELPKIGGAPVEDYNSTTSYNISVSGQAYRRAGYEYRTFQYFIPKIEQDELNETVGAFTAFSQQGAGFIIPYDDGCGIDQEALYVIYDGKAFKPIFRNTQSVVYQANFSFREAF